MECGRMSFLLLAVAAMAALAVAPAQTGATGVLFASLPKTIIVNAKVNGQNITADNSVKMDWKTGQLQVSWKLNDTAAVDTSQYKAVLFKLCFGVNDAVDRPWRQNDPDLLKSKTCKYAIKHLTTWNPAGSNFTVNSTVVKSLQQTPGAHYFVRAFVMNDTECITTGDCAVAFGQTANKNRTSPLFYLVPYSGRHATLIGTAVAISCTSYLALGAFFVVERSLKKRS